MTDATEGSITRMSLAEARRRYDAGDYVVHADAPEGPDLPDSFWENAVRSTPPEHEEISAMNNTVIVVKITPPSNTPKITEKQNAQIS